MYRNRKFNKNAPNKRTLNIIGEDTTVKISHSSGQLPLEVNKDITTFEDNIFENEENIPASQEPTQRYLSQRSNILITATLARTQSRLNNTQRAPNSYFELALQKAGVQLDEGEQFVLVHDHVTFVNKLRDLLNERKSNSKDHIDIFLRGLKESWSKLSSKLLSGCTISTQGEGCIYQSQDSMIANFFMIEFLRDRVLDLLLDKIDQAATNKKQTQTSSDHNFVPLFPLMLAQLRYVSIIHGDRIYKRIKDIFGKAHADAKHDLISTADYIIDASKQDEFAQLMLDNLSSNRELFQDYCINTLINLNLSLRMHSKISNKILSYIREDQNFKANISLLVKFLLKNLIIDNEDTLHELVNMLRDILNWNDNTGNLAHLATDKSMQLELFGYIEQGLIRSKKFYSIWQKLIATQTSTQFKSIDFVMLILFIHIREDNSMYIENILRRQVKKVPSSIITNIRRKYTPILEYHWNIFMQVLNNFLRDKHKSVVDFARLTCGTFFGISESIQKQLLRKLLDLTCEQNTLNTTTFALCMLRDLWQQYPRILHNWGNLLLPFLDHIHNMSLSQTRIVMELLSSIAFPIPPMEECPILQEQIDILIKKQLINRNLFVKQQGIIGCVQLIDCLARIEQTRMESEDLEITFSTISDLPDGRGKIAANYIVRIQTLTQHSPELLALFYDELSIMCGGSVIDRAQGLLLDKPFLIWLCELMTYYFQNSFVCEYVPDQLKGINLSYQKCINSTSDISTDGQHSELPSIAINISELVLNPSNEAISSILVLSPLFNLVRVLQMQRCDGSLEIINALLGCAIILPNFFDDLQPETLYSDYDLDIQKKILDIYFYCTNWLRETISSFVTQREKMIRQKVLRRLGELISIENKIKQMLSKAPSNYTPPQCQFITEVSVKNSVRNPTGKNCNVSINNRAEINKKTIKRNAIQCKRAKDINESKLNNTDSDDVNMTALLGANKGKTNISQNIENIYGPKEIYRQMDTNVILVLEEKLTLTYPLPSEDVGEKIGLLEFRFILTDIVGKLESVVGIKKFQSEFTFQYIAKPEYFMCDLSNFIKIIDENMIKIANTIQNKLDVVNHLYSHADLFTVEFNLLKVCFALCLRLLVAFYSWSEWFVNDKRMNKLKDSLFILKVKEKSNRSRGNTSSKSVVTSILAAEVFTKFLAYESIVLDLKSATYLYQLMVTLNILSSKEFKDKQAQQIRSLSRTLLCRKWYHYDGTLEKGSQCNIYLAELVCGFLRDSDFQRQREILRILSDECKQLNGKDATLKSFPNFKKANFPLLFRGLCDILISALNYRIMSNDLPLNSEVHLEYWQSSCQILNELLSIVQVVDIPRNFQIFLKYSHLYLKLTLQHGIHVFEQHLRHNPESVCELIKNMQTTTRFLHHLCCHSKVIRSTVIVSQIPSLRETVENFVFRIKALLTANKCASVFTMGNLRNKDLHGDEVLSQAVSVDAFTTRGDSEEELPDDDVSITETLMEVDDPSINIVTNETYNSNKSRSKCY